MAPHRTNRAATTGFSLIEFIMVMIVFAIVSAIAAPLLAETFRAYFIGKDIAETDWQARVALERMTRELRSVRAPTDLIITSAGDITFVTAVGTSIRYCLGTVGTCPGVATELMRNTQPLASGISALNLTFLTRAGAATALPASVFYVNIAFTATQNTVSKTYTATVSPRNFP